MSGGRPCPFPSRKSSTKRRHGSPRPRRRRQRRSPPGGHRPWRRRQRANRAAGERGPAEQPAAEREAGTRKVRQGGVVSSKGEKTITVRLENVRRHRLYEKVLRESNTLHAHDEQNEAN